MALRSANISTGLTHAAIEGLAYLSERILTFRATAHEGSQGAVKLAALEEGHTTPRSKLYVLRLHWLCSWLHQPNKDIEIDFVDTALQKADMLTKSLNPSHFEANRRLSMGW